MSLFSCPECKKKISDSVQHCPHCGYSIRKNHSLWYNRKFIVICALIFAFPIGMYGMWKSSRFGIGSKILITFITLLFTISYLSSYFPQSDLLGLQSVSAPGGSHTQSEEVSRISFTTIRANTLDMTEAQFNIYTKSLVGTRVVWSGWVDDVDEKLLGGYRLLVDMDGPSSPLRIKDVTIPIADTIATKFNKNERITFEATIDRISRSTSSCLIDLSNATFDAY
ncbi:MAG: zinc ribbon domain-containing protein [Chitinivibrionales bacterium]|nr:zinc ribbon domain-containing protein [Chitinivibrionales bacterium]